jgi:acetyl esterase/lipase
MFRLFCTFAVGTLLAAALTAADAPPTLDLWPGTAPGEKGNVPPEVFGDPKAPPGTPVKSVTNVTKPTITVYKPEASVNTGAAIIIAPGGGYKNLSWENEGTKVAKWCQSIGVTGVLLKYRVPRRPDQPQDQPPIGALQDAQRAVSLVRANAKEWGVDPNRIGFLGFSAGGHLTGWVATNADKRAYEIVDAADKLSSRPDFAVLIYPGGIVDKETKEMKPEIRVSKETPPCFFALAYNDPGPLDGSLKMMQALKQAGVKSELHVYSEGGHGFGMKGGELPAGSWPKRCEEWLRAEGYLSAAKK